MLERVTNLVDLDFVLQEKHLILVAQNDCQPLPPSMESSAFGVFTLFVILGNFCYCCGIFEPSQSQVAVISAQKGYKFD